MGGAGARIAACIPSLASRRLVADVSDLKTSRRESIFLQESVSLTAFEQLCESVCRLVSSQRFVRLTPGRPVAPVFEHLKGHLA